MDGFSASYSARRTFPRGKIYVPHLDSRANIHMRLDSIDRYSTNDDLSLTVDFTHSERNVARPKAMPAPVPRTKAKSKDKGAATDADVATNAALLAHAEATRLAKSWLATAFPPSVAAAHGAAGDKDEEGEEEEEDEQKGKLLLENQDLYSETGGLGYHAPPDGSGPPGNSRAADATTTFLRRQLLGRGRGGSNHHSPSSQRPSIGRPPHRARRTSADDEDDVEESRSRGSYQCVLLECFGHNALCG